jgi:L-alanine-DL-glutamate epimerase-like enolase superfamily enzyme
MQQEETMNNDGHARLRLRADIEQWPMKAPFHITGYTFTDMGALTVSLHQDGMVGRGEALGVYYHHETPASMLAQIEALRGPIEAGVTRQQLSQLLPAGGARSYPGARALKLKLTNDELNAERVRAVRAACPDAWIMVDANQGFTRESFARLLPALVDARISVVEQPFPVGSDAWLDGLDSPILLAADESVQDRNDLENLVGRVGMINIKLDKCGGLTEALAMAARARELGFDLMVGNMSGSSLAMAPGFVLGQQCTVVDLDGPAFLKRDRASAVSYEDGHIWCADTVWGGPLPAAA